jgi:2-oxo-4-hydroxy-4-carboxy--5-ureidoimidazoline (OHCU) decarboxylase/GNAT superfamily N-acetyltransferase
MALTVRDLAPKDHDWADRLIASHQGSRMTARLGELVDPLTRQGLVAELDGKPVGLVTVDETDRGLELLTVDSETPGTGAGTRLLETALQVAAASGCRRIWLVTTNDNLPAIRFYLRRGMHVAAVHRDQVARDRALKPEISETNPENGIPIRDLVELELPTAGADTLPFRAFPRIEDLDRLPDEAAADAMRVLFEDAPTFVARLGRQRPFGSDDALIQAARATARSLPDDEQVGLLNAHPRIGADPESVSAMSHTEQGYDEVPQESAPESASEPEEEGSELQPELESDDAEGPAPVDESWIADELEALNDAYERRFGFRFVIFVAGRPRSEILPILERSLRDDRDGELRRGLDDVVYIAADRLSRLRDEESEAARR